MYIKKAVYIKLPQSPVLTSSFIYFNNHFVFNSTFQNKLINLIIMYVIIIIKKKTNKQTLKIKEKSTVSIEEEKL